MGNEIEHLTTPGQAPGLLGRERERAALEQMLARARAGTGDALIVRGAPGVGKSALLSLAATLAGDFCVLAVTGVESESELPFCGLSDLLSSELPGGNERLLAALPGPQALALRGALRLAPESAQDPLAVYAGLRGLLCAASVHTPLLMLIDDAHWIDAASREALQFTARRAALAPIVMVFGIREDTGEQLADAGIAEMRLEGLEPTAAAALTSRLAPRIATSVALALHEQTEGNPLALVELSSCLDEHQLAGRSPLPSPLPVGPRLEQVFARRLDPLAPATRDALLIGASSETTRMDLIRAAMALLDVPADAFAPAERELLVEVHEGSLRWRHPLVRSAVYQRATLARRREVHRALAEAAGSEGLADQRAWHLAAAAEAPDEQVAAELERMAERARARGGSAVLARTMTAAATLTPAPERRADRLLAAAEATVAMGRSGHAVELLEHALEISEDPRKWAIAERLRARVDILAGVPQVAHDRLVVAARRLEQEDPLLASQMLSEAVVAHMASGSFAEYVQTASHALAVSERAPQGADSLPGLLLAMGMLASGAGDAAIAQLDRYAAIAQDPQMWLAMPEIAGMMGLALLWIERYEEAERLLTAVTVQARSGGAIRALAFPLTVQADLHFQLGRWPAALSAAREAVSLAEDVGEGALLANNLLYLARIQAGLGMAAECRANAERGLALSATYGLGAVAPYGMHALALLAIGESSYEEALAHLEGIDESLPDFTDEPGLSRWDPDRVEVYIRAKRPAPARRALERYERAVEFTNRAQGRAALARLHGLIGPDGDLERHFEHSLRLYQRLPLPFERARTHLCYGERLRRARMRRQAREQLTAALSTFQALGAQRWAERTRRELAAAGARRGESPAPHAGRDERWSLLTPQQARVVREILAGATYREAADALYLSPRTVESHLRQVYRALGIRSRSELLLSLGGGSGDGAERP